MSFAEYPQAISRNECHQARALSAVVRISPRQEVFEHRQRPRSLSAKRSRKGPPVRYYSSQVERLRTTTRATKRNDLASIRGVGFEYKSFHRGGNPNPDSRRVQFLRKLEEDGNQTSSSIGRVASKGGVRNHQVYNAPLGDRVKDASYSHNFAREPDGSTSRLASSDPPTNGPTQPLFSPSLWSQEFHASPSSTKSTRQHKESGPPPTPRRNLTSPNIQQPLRAIENQRVRSPNTVQRDVIHYPSPACGSRPHQKTSQMAIMRQDSPSHERMRSPLRTHTQGHLLTPPRNTSTRSYGNERPPRPSPSTIQSQKWDPSVLCIPQEDEVATRESVSAGIKYKRTPIPFHANSETPETLNQRGNEYGWKSPAVETTSQAYSGCEGNRDKRVEKKHLSQQKDTSLFQNRNGHDGAATENVALPTLQARWGVQSKSSESKASIDSNHSDQSQYRMVKYAFRMNGKFSPSKRRAIPGRGTHEKNNEIYRTNIKSDDECPPFFSEDDLPRKKSIFGLFLDWMKKNDGHVIKRNRTHDADEALPERELQWSEIDRRSASSQDGDDVYLISKTKAKEEQKRYIPLMICSIISCLLGAGIPVYFRVFAPGVQGKRMPSLNDSCVSAKLVGNNSTYWQNNFTFSQRFNTIGEIIQTSSVNGQGFEVVNSPQRRALCWLADFDGLHLDASESNSPALVQRYAIAVIRFALGGSNPLRTQNLQKSVSTAKDHECQWKPAMCNGQNQVTALLLGDASLQGQIPHEIGNLKNLTFLDLSLNEISGSIPSSVGRLTMLEYLSLSFNEFSSSIPVAVSKLVRLEFLNLRSSKVNGTIPEEIGELSRLETLLLDGNELTGTIPSTLANLQKAQAVSFRKNFLSGSVPQELCHLKNQSNVELRVDAWVDCDCYQPLPVMQSAVHV